MDQLITALPALLRAASNTEEVTQAAALAVWSRVVGEGLAKQTLAIGLRQQRLTIAVADPVWQRQLESLSGQLLRRLNALMGSGTVRFIEFRIDPKVLENHPLQKRPAPVTSGGRQAETAVPFELMSAAASIHDPALRRAFLGAASSCVRRRESQKKELQA